METTTIETQAASEAPPTADLSLDQIIAEAVSAAGDNVIKEDAPATTAAATETPPGEAPPAETPPAETPPAEEPKPDDISAARVRKMLEKLDEREAALTAREAELGGVNLAEFLKAPKAWLAKHGRSIDDVIDASLAEGKAPEAAPEADRLTALEKRIEARETRERQAATDAAIADRKAEIHRAVTTSAAKFPIINESKRHGLVTDYMVEYHAMHGKAITWDRAAAAVEQDLASLVDVAAPKRGYTKAQAAAAKGEPPARTGTVSIGGNARDAAPTEAEEPSDPNDLIKFYAAQAGLG